MTEGRQRELNMEEMSKGWGQKEDVPEHQRGG